MVQQIGSLLAVLSVFVLSSNAVKCPGTATYKLSWKADWTKENHPMTDLPSNAHFSDLIGCSHSADYIMWRRGQKASPGVKLVAERGQTGTLRSEIESQISDGKAWQLILPRSGLGAVGELNNIQVNVNSNFSRVSLISMLAPSPDWFVGIDSHDLCDNGQWRETWNVTMLPPYDSGTDSGQQFINNNLPTQPAVDIFRISHTMEGVFKAQNPIPSLGEFRFKGLNLPVIQMNHSDGSASTVMYKPTTSPNDSASKDSVGLFLFSSATFVLAWLY